MQKCKITYWFRDLQRCSYGSPSSADIPPGWGSCRHPSSRRYSWCQEGYTPWWLSAASTATTKTRFDPRSYPSNTHFPLTSRPWLYFRLPNFASSISTVTPGPPSFCDFSSPHFTQTWEIVQLMCIWIGCISFVPHIICGATSHIICAGEISGSSDLMSLSLSSLKYLKMQKQKAS